MHDPHQESDHRRGHLAYYDQGSSLLAPVRDLTPQERLAQDIHDHRKGREEGGFGDRQAQEETKIDREKGIEETAPEHDQNLEGRDPNKGVKPAGIGPCSLPAIHGRQCTTS